MLIFAALHKFNHTKKREKKTHNGHRKNGTIVYFTDHNLIHDKTFKMPKKKKLYLYYRVEVFSAKSEVTKRCRIV